MRVTWKVPSVAAVAIVMLAAGAAHGRAVQTGAATDTRQRVTLPPTQRNQILAEMRGMLESVRAILFGLAANDMPAVARAAQSSAVEPVNPQLDQKLPDEFLRFRQLTHQGFQSLAEQARAGGTQTDIIRKLANVTNNCVGCHTAYRAVEGPASASRGAAPTTPK